MLSGTDCMMADNRVVTIDDPRIRVQAIRWILFQKGNTCARCGNPLPDNVQNPAALRVQRVFPGDNRFGNLELIHVDCQAGTEGAQAPGTQQLGLDL